MLELGVGVGFGVHWWFWHVCPVLQFPQLIFVLQFGSVPVPHRQFSSWHVFGVQHDWFARHVCPLGHPHVLQLFVSVPFWQYFGWLFEHWL